MTNGGTRGVTGGGEVRGISTEMRLIAALLSGVVDDVARTPRCVRHKLAIAWLFGVYECGCEYEATGPSFDDIAARLGEDPGRLREMIVTTSREPKRRRQRRMRQLEAEGQMRLGLDAPTGLARGSFPERNVCG